MLPMPPIAADTAIGAPIAAIARGIAFADASAITRARAPAGSLCRGVACASDVSIA